MFRDKAECQSMFREFDTYRNKFGYAALACSPWWLYLTVWRMVEKKTWLLQLETEPHGNCPWAGCLDGGTWATRPALVNIKTTRVDWHPSNLHKSASWWEHKLSEDFSTQCVPKQTPFAQLEGVSPDTWECLGTGTTRPAKLAVLRQRVFLSWGYFCKSHSCYTYKKLSLWLGSEILTRHCQYRHRIKKAIGFSLLLHDWQNLGLEEKGVLEWRCLQQEM